MRFGDLPTAPGQPPRPAEQATLVMKIALPIFGGHVIIGNDAPAHPGQRNQENSVPMNLKIDTRSETDHLFAARKEGGTVE